MFIPRIQCQGGVLCERTDLINSPLTLAGAVSAMYEGAACIANPAGRRELNFTADTLCAFQLKLQDEQTAHGVCQGSSSPMPRP